MAITSTAPRTARTDLTILAAATIALRIPAFMAERALSFDDSVYGASAVAMRAGGAPFRDVFSSQGPLWLPLVWAGDVLGLRTLNAPRMVSLLAAVLLVCATYLAGRAVTDRAGALLAAALVTATASIIWVTGPIASDGAALALATSTVVLALRWRSECTWRRAVWLGLGVGATISVKALLAPVIVPIALVLIAGRRPLPILVGAVTAIGFHLLLWVPWGPANVWDQSYGYHLEVAGQRTPGANLAKLASTMADRDLPLLLAAGLVLGAIALHRRSTTPAPERRLTSPDTLLLAWLGATAVILLAEHPLWRPHVAHLLPPIALLIARHRPPGKVLAVLLVVALPYHVVHAWSVLHPTGYTGSSAEMVEMLQELPPGALAMSDDPGIVWRAGRRTPPDLVDTSILRIEAGQHTAASIAQAAADASVCAVAVLSSARWGSFDDLGDRLAAVGYDVALEDEKGRTLYLAEACDPG
jgi:hypothetical protein